MPTSKLSHDSDEPDEAVEAVESETSDADAADAATSKASKKPSATDSKTSTGPELTKARQKAIAASTRKTKTRNPRVVSPNPVWLVPTMLTLLIGGLVWIVVFYVTSGLLTFNLPIPGIGHWNLAVGFGLILGGGILSTQYK